MQCSVMLERDHHGGNVKMKTVNNYKNPYEKEPNLDNIVDQLCTRLQDIKDQEGTTQVGMPTRSIEQAEAVRRYYAAFPALKKGRESPQQYYLPPPAWCRESHPDFQNKMQSELPLAKEVICKKKLTSGKERRNSYHGQRKNKKRCNSYSRSFESKESLPEWVTHEGVWDMETQDPVKEFIRAIALDEGYGTCENTVTDEIKEITEVKVRMCDNVVPDWDDSLDLGAQWVITEDLDDEKIRTPMEEELYAKFEAKFDRSIEALWSKDQNTPDDEYQDLPIDFQDLLSSPSDRLFVEPAAGECSLISLTESIWSNEAPEEARGFVDRSNSPSRIADGLHDRFKPLNLADAEPQCPPRELETFTLYEGEDIYDALSTVAETMRSYTAINHSRDHSGFVEVPPRRRSRAPIKPVEEKPPIEAPPASPPREDLLTAARTHFKPIRGDPETGRYLDGDYFDIPGDLETVEFTRSESGGVYLTTSHERYLEYRSGSIDYSRLNLTESQRCPDLDDNGFKLRFPMRQVDTGVQTDLDESWGACECGQVAKKMRSNAIDGIWGESRSCSSCEVKPESSVVAPVAEELSREWEELLSDISAAHAVYVGAELAAEALVSADRKRRHSAALRPGRARPSCSHALARFVPSLSHARQPPSCSHPLARFLPSCSRPHARFVPCCAHAMHAERPLTR